MLPQKYFPSELSKSFLCYLKNISQALKVRLHDATKLIRHATCDKIVCKRAYLCDMRLLHAVAGKMKSSNFLATIAYRNKPVYIVRFWRTSHGRMFTHRVNAPLHLIFCRAGLKIGTGPSTRVARVPSLLRKLILPTARLSVYTCVKAGTANRGGETDVFGSARHV